MTARGDRSAARAGEAWTEEALLRALRRSGAPFLERVRFRENRSTIWSISSGGRALNLHAGYRRAPAPVVLHFAVLLREVARPGRRRSEAWRTAAGAVRRWPGLRPALARARRRRPPRRSRARRPRTRHTARPGPCCATPEQRRFLEGLYRRLARNRFHGILPEEVFVRLSRRMTSRLGQMLGDHERLRRHGRAEPTVRRRVVEIVLSLDLMLPGNEAELVDTLLHEMAHAADWLESGGHGHGHGWKEWARRVGCLDRSRARGPIRRRRRASDPVEHVPVVDFTKPGRPHRR